MTTFNHDNKIEKGNKVHIFITNVMDFIPVIGSFKMIVEGFRGKQLMTRKEFKGILRVLHTLMGAIFLWLDITGIGVILSEFGKAAIKFSELLMLRKIEEHLVRRVFEEEIPRTYNETQE